MESKVLYPKVFTSNFVLLIDSVDWLPADVTLVDKIKSNPLLLPSPPTICYDTFNGCGCDGDKRHYIRT